MNDSTQSKLHVFKGTSDEIWIKTTAHVRQDHGRTLDVPFKIRARVPATSEIVHIQEKTKAGEMDDADVAREYVVDWEMPGRDGENIPFDLETLDAALEHPDYLAAITEGLMELIFGREALRIKNSMKSGKPGRVAQ